MTERYRKYRDMDDDELVALRRDMALVLDAASKKAARLRGSLNGVRTALERKSYQRDQEAGVPVKVVDHAIVRYLERVKGVNMNVIRNEIREMVAKGVAEERTGEDVILYDGYVFLQSAHKITTVLTQEMYENMDFEEPEGDSNVEHASATPSDS